MHIVLLYLTNVGYIRNVLGFMSVIYLFIKIFGVYCINNYITKQHDYDII